MSRPSEFDFRKNIEAALETIRRARVQQGCRSRRKARATPFRTVECLESRTLITSVGLAREFGDNSVTVSSFANFESEGASTRDVEGRIILVGTVRLGATSSTNDFVVARYTSDGQLDVNFGINGRTTIDFGSGDSARAVAVDHQGRIVVVGTRVSAGTSEAGVIVVARLTPDGQLDATFGSAGKAVFTTGYNALWAATAVAVQSDDRILISGYVREIFDTTLWDYVSSRFLIMRLTTTGVLDRTFGEQPVGNTADQRNGIRRVGFGGRTQSARNSHNFGYGLTVDPLDQSIIQVGEGDGERPAILKYDSDGSLLMYHQNEELFDGWRDGRAEDVVITATGQVVVSGREGSSSFIEFLSRTLERTSLLLYRDIEADLGGAISLNALAAQEDGGTVAAGVIRTASGPRVLLSRFNAQQELDDLFGEHGTVIAATTAFAPSIPAGGQFGTAAGGGVVLQDRGRIVVSGTVQLSSGRDLFLAAFAEQTSRQEFHAQLEWFAKDHVYRTNWLLGDDVMFGYSVDAIWEDSATGLYGFGLTSEDAEAPPVLVLRGTEARSDIFDVLDDLNPEGIGFAQFESARTRLGQRRSEQELGPVQTTTMADWLQSVSSGGTPVMTGHSLGGALVQWLAAYCTGTLSQPLGEIVTFNAPGISTEAADQFVPSLVELGVTHYVVQGDIVSMGGERFLFGQVRFATFGTGSLLATEILGSKHLKPILASGIGGHPVPSGLTLGEPQSTAWLNAPYFLYPNLEYLLAVSELSAVLGAVSGNPDAALLPLNALFRATAENKRRQFGEQLRPIIGGLQVATATPGLHVPLPEFQFQLPGLIQINTSGLSLQYLGGPDNSIRFTGQSEITVSGLPTLMADFSGDRFLEVTQSGIGGIGELSVRDVVIVQDELIIDSAALLVDTVTRRLAGSATVTVPPGIGVSGRLEFMGNRLASVSLSVSDLSVPIPVPEPPVFFITQLGASVARLDEPDPFPEIAGTIGVSVGPRVRIPLPAWLGSGTSIELASIAGMATIAPESLAGRLGVNLLNGWITSAENTFSQTTWNWEQGLIEIDGQVQVTGPASFTATGSVQTTINGRLSIDSAGEVSFTLPDVPGNPFRGRQIPIGQLTGQYRHNLNLRDDFILVQSAIPIGSKVLVRVGAKVSLEGAIAFLDLRLIRSSRVLEALALNATAAGPSFASADQLYNDSEPIPVAVESFEIESAADTMLLVLDWENDVGAVELQIIDPQGVVYDEAAVAASPNLELLTELTRPNGRVVGVANATPGTWTVQLHASQDPGQVTSAAYVSDLPATLEIDRVDLSGTELTIDYHAADPDSEEVVSFYLDTDGTGADGVPIGTAPELDGSSRFKWINTSIPTGEYWVYAVIDSPAGLPVVAYASSSIRLPDPQLAVTVTVVDQDAMAFQITDGNLGLLRNGLPDVEFVPVAARYVQSLLVTGGTGANRLDLSAVTAAQFPELHGITVDGNAGSDTLIGSELADLLLGGDGNDVLAGGAGNDVISGGAGVDMLAEIQDFSMVLSGNSTSGTLLMTLVNGAVQATDTLSSIEAASLRGGTSHNRMDLSAWISPSITTLIGGGGRDTIIGSPGRDRISTFSSGRDSIQGGDGNDTIATGNGDDTIDGGEGNDSIQGQGGNDSIIGGSGDDNLAGSEGNDTVLGQGGNDRLFGLQDNDLLDGGNGNDSLFGASGNDTLLGGAGKDLLRGEAGTDSMNGGAGIDRVDESINADVTIVGMQIQSVVLGTETAVGVERFVLTGGSSANLFDAHLATVEVQLTGNGGNDTLLAGSGNDTVRGNDGNDVLSGGGGTDVIEGGAGTDFWVESANANFTVTGLQISSTASGTETGIDIERIALEGGVGNNNLNASGATVPVLLLGGLGNDTLTGGSGNDTLTGGFRGDTTVAGSDGIDSLDGGAGTDALKNDPSDTLSNTGGDTLQADVFSLLPDWLDLV